MKEIYNAVILLAPDKKDLAKERKIKELIKKEADYIDDKSIGEQDLAYEIEGESSGYYFWIDFDIKSKDLKKIKSKIDNINPLRYLISKKPMEAVEKRKKEEPASPAAPKRKEGETKEIERQEKRKIEKEKPAKPKKRKKESKGDEKKRIENLDKKLEEIL